LTPPIPNQKLQISEIHGHKRVDPYAWLREREDPAVIAHLEAENAYTASVMAPTESLQERLYEEFLGRILEDDSNPPYPKGDFVYFSRTEKGKQYRIYCRAPKATPETVEVILDLNQEAVGHKFMSIELLEMSDDSHWLAYALDTTGYRQFTLRFKDLRTGEVSSTVVERVTSMCWGADNRDFFYTTEDEETKRSDCFWRHRVGAAEPRLLFEEEDELYDLACGRSRQGKMLFLHSMAKTSSEVRFAPAQTPENWSILATREPLHEYDADHRDGMFYIRTNRGAENFKIVTASEQEPSEWQDLVAHDERTMIEAVDLFETFIVLSERQAGMQQLEIRPDGAAAYLIPLPEPIHCVGLDVNKEFSTVRLRYNYQSPITPPSIREIHLASRTSTVLKEHPVLGYRREDFHCERLEIAVRDGTMVPVSLVYRADIEPGSGFHPSPMVLYGYGSYGVSIDPGFSSNRVSLLQRGVIFAIAHIRGGGELGEPWRLAGRMDTKMNTFTDFIDCSEGLVARGYTAPDRLVITGASAGGLLVGAVSNMRPELFTAVLSKVPFVDVVNTMLDASLPLTTSEYIEWGNPNEPEAFERMLEYSPYDNVRAQPYPSMLIEVSLHDSQVPYWEGAKLVARLRELKTDDRPILLKTNLDAGHGGASGRYDALREAAFDYAYMLQRLGLQET
jgi:oligopeptidase B